MSMITIGKLQRVRLREVWPHEALDFTRWLEENIEVLSEAIDITLVSAEREKTTGSFSADILAEDEDGNPVIIENQLGQSNHDHLGKLITYLTGLEAKTAIWIVAEPRQEHVRAVSWLNESSSVSFYLLKLEAVQIGESQPAPLLTPIVAPSAEGREAGEKKKELAERHHIRHDFWTKLLDKAREKTNLHANITASRGSWVGTGAGKAGLTYNYDVLQHDARVELYIDRGKDAGDENEVIFDQLHAKKEQIEDAFGGTLNWQRLEDRRACRISKQILIGGYRDKERWPRIHEAMIEAMVRLEQALSSHIARMEV